MIMQQHYELSDTEYKIMQLFWKNSDPLPFNEILKYCNDELQLNWAVGTAQTYLNRLILKGVLKTNNKRYRKLYSAQLSEEELAQKYARQFVDESFGFISLFDDVEQIEKEERLQTAIDSIRDQFGFTSLLKANALDSASRSIARSSLIGGHSAGGLDGLK